MELYISVDIESDGPIPQKNSMLSLGAVAFIKQDTSWKEVGDCSINLEQLEGANPDPRTMSEFWDKNPEAWKACRTNLVSPQVGMKLFVSWVKGLSKKYDAKPVCVAYPAGFDFLFLYQYMILFAGESPFGFSALDMKTLGMALLKKEYRKTVKRRMPKHWFVKIKKQGLKHNHIAVDDAREQGLIFCAMMDDLLKDSEE